MKETPVQNSTTITTDDLDMIDGVIRAYYQRHVTGGSLHIVLDDGNWNRSSIEFCLSVAKGRYDFVGEAIAKFLLQAPDKVIQECKDTDWQFGLQVWKDMVCK